MSNSTALRRSRSDAHQSVAQKLTVHNSAKMKKRLIFKRRHKRQGEKIGPKMHKNNIIQFGANGASKKQSQNKYSSKLLGRSHTLPNKGTRATPLTSLADLPDFIRQHSQTKK